MGNGEFKTDSNDEKEGADGRLVFGGIRAGLQGAVGGAVAGVVGALSLATKKTLIFYKKDGSIWCDIPQTLNWDNGSSVFSKTKFGAWFAEKKHEKEYITAKVTAIDALQNTKRKAWRNKFARNFTIRFETGECPECVGKNGYKLNCTRCNGNGSVGACDRVIEYRSLKKEGDNILNMIKAIEWIKVNEPEDANLFTEKCSYNDLLDALENKDTFVNKPKEYIPVMRTDKRRLASCWTSAVLRYAMDSIENMEALDERPRASRLSLE